MKTSTSVTLLIVVAMLVGCDQDASPATPAATNSPSLTNQTAATSPSDNDPAATTDQQESKVLGNTSGNLPQPAATPTVTANVPDPIPANLVAMDGLNIDDWIASAQPDSLVKEIPLTTRTTQTKDEGIRFSVLHGESLFRFRPVLRRQFVVRFTVALDEVPSDIKKVTWAAGTLDTSKGKLEIVIPATANIADGKPHDFEFAFGPTNASLKFDGHLCKTLAHTPEEKPWPRQFYLFGRGEVAFTISNFQVFVDPISLDENAEPRALTTSPGIRPSVFQPRPPIEGETQVDVGGNIERAVLGGDGKFLVLHNRGEQLVQVLDVPQRAIVSEIPVADERLLLTAGRDHFVIYYPEQRKLHSRSFETFKIVTAKDIPEDAILEHLTMGGSATDKLLTIRQDPEFASIIEFLDPQTLEKIDIEVVQPEKNPLPVHKVNGIRADATGVMYGMITQMTPTSTTSSYSIQVFGKQAIIYVPHDRGDNGGSFQFGPEGIWPQTVCPSYCGNYQLIVKETTPHNGFTAIDAAVSLLPQRENVALDPSKSALATLTDLDFTDDHSFPFSARWGDGDLMPTERINFIESLNTIITIPRTNHHVVFRDFNLKQYLQQQGVDYCYMLHQPTLRALRGKTFQAEFEIRASSKIYPKFTALDGSLRDMQFDEKRVRVRWKVPESVSEFLHFNIRVSDNPQGTGFPLLTGLIPIHIVDPPTRNAARSESPETSEPVAQVPESNEAMPEPKVTEQEVLVSMPGENGMRTWTDSDGRTMTARLLKRVGELIRVETEDGRGFTLPMSRLSEADQKFVEQTFPGK
ncbi:hypothetical protein DTL21_05305 [Bremerella cremea]|uniref:SLA1 homology domain-containing protein n=1 Tax=Blastopirellula marina TaxID=124 RepID=A0A2S8FYU8_9BACT|nr:MULTISPECIES: hypothetical protein [Pirellulaceae]PQO37363.1 hypothetical protein C5Y83_05305 [Blastopirellula marina]RCS49750.1 hypothetical protein DTL21_05305 [Bremerella cremea]